MRQVILFTFLGLLFVTTPDPVAAKTGNELYQECSVRESEATHYQSDAYCVAFIRGVAEMLILTKMFNDTALFKACIPSSVTAGQLRDVVMKDLEDHPEDRNLEAPILIWSAVNRAWPCDSSPDQTP